MKKICFLLVLLTVSVLAFSNSVSVYRYDDTQSKWVTVEVISADATGVFTTESVPGNINGFIPINLISNYGRVNYSVTIPTTLSVQIDYKAGLGTYVYGEWATDDVHVLFRSNDQISLSYSLTDSNGSNQTYYQTKVDDTTPPSEGFKNWNQAGSNPGLSKLDLADGAHSFYLWLGFDNRNTNQTLSVRDLIFVTYIVPYI